MSLMIAALPVYAQESSTPPPPASSAPASTPAPAAATAAPAASTPAPASSSDADLKKARAAGLRPETRKGATVYCYEDSNIGSHFTTKKCVDASQLDALIAQRQATKNAVMQGPMMGTSSK